ncbi:hypothetical protein A0H81_05172 [Grifola frondosa]|uniref:BTB domain-containing protein n=1 Tax=Grifola frondosa TaxID=5627 RepID=A0A1C7MF18_GRIFR|nr:hypothetical protein A0H81_05172 [Grifola frondosa]
MEASAVAASKKRRRVGTSKVDIDDVKRDEDLWFHDGSIVIVAGDTAFRVYQGLLMKQSEIFRDLFSMPQPVVVETMDGCPVVKVSDSPKDMKYLLEAIHSLGFFDPKKTLKFVAISALIRLGHKYAIEHLVDQALSLLKTEYPTSLTSWLVRWHKDYACKEDMDPIEVVYLARLTQTSSLLPTALYRCCQLESRLVEGTHRPDGTHVQLTADDLKRCMAGKTILVQEQVRVMLGCFDWEVSSTCNTKPRCRRSFLQAIAHVRNFPDIMAEFDPFREMDSADWFDKFGGLCDDCCNMFDGRVREARNDVWSNLPAYMDVEVEGWPT